MNKEIEALIVRLEAALRLKKKLAFAFDMDDDRNIVELLTDAIAALRQQSPQPAEPVAWCYTCRSVVTGPIFSAIKQDWADSGSGVWTEIPLFTSPQPAEPFGVDGESIHKGFYEATSRAKNGGGK